MNFILSSINKLDYKYYLRLEDGLVSPGYVPHSVPVTLLHRLQSSCKSSMSIQCKVFLPSYQGLLGHILLDRSSGPSC